MNQTGGAQGMQSMDQALHKFVKDGRVTHTQNGVKVVEYELWTPKWDEMVQNSKFKTFPGFTEGIAKEGFVGLQDHGYSIWFRNIKIREL